MSKATVKLSTLMAANAAIKHIESAEAALKAMQSDYYKKNYGSKANAFPIYVNAGGNPIYIPSEAVEAGLTALIETSKEKLEKLGVEVDA